MAQDFMDPIYDDPVVITRTTTASSNTPASSVQIVKRSEENVENLFKTIEFGLGKYQQSLTCMQYKFVAMAIYQIQSVDNSKYNSPYEYPLNPTLMAEKFGVSSSNKKYLLEKARDFFNMSPSLTIDVNGKTKIFHVSQSVTLDHESGELTVKYSEDFYHLVKKMVSQYDTFYPLAMIAQLKTSYAIPFFYILISRIAEKKYSEEQNLFSDNIFNIEITVEDLRSRLQLGSMSVGHITERVVKKSLSEITEKTSLKIIGLERIIRDRELIAYIIKVNPILTPELPLFNTERTITNDIYLPSDSYLAHRLVDIGIVESFIQHCFSNYSIEYIWKSYLYTICKMCLEESQSDMSEIARYFNACVKKNYAESAVLEQLFLQVYNESDRLLKDEIGLAIYNHYMKDKKVIEI